MEDMKEQNEAIVSIDVPASAVAAVTDFLEKRSRGVDAGFCFGVALPTFGTGIKSWAVLDVVERKWSICTEQDAHGAGAR
jgi:hypothetical protein